MKKRKGEGGKRDLKKIGHLGKKTERK